MDHPILMGRKTFESIGRPLPGRHNIVVTRSGKIEGVEIVRDLEKFNPALYEANGKDVFVIGGSEIYRALLPKCESYFEVSEVLRETPLYDVLLYRRAREV